METPKRVIQTDQLVMMRQYTVQLAVPRVMIYIEVGKLKVLSGSPYYKGHGKVMCVSSPVYPVIIGNVRGTRQMLPDPDWKAEDQIEARARTSGGNNDDDDSQGGDMPSWMFKEESNRGKTKNRDSKKKPAQIRKNYNHATEDIKVQRIPQKEP